MSLFPTHVGDEAIVTYPADVDWLGNVRLPQETLRVRAVEVGRDRRGVRYFDAEVVNDPAAAVAHGVFSVFESEVERGVLTIEPISVEVPVEADTAAADYAVTIALDHQWMEDR